MQHFISEYNYLWQPHASPKPFPPLLSALKLPASGEASEMVHRNPALIRRDANEHQKHAFITLLLKAWSADGEADRADLEDKLLLHVKVLIVAPYITQTHNNNTEQAFMHDTKCNNY